jgi:hypothetical protein
MRLIRPLKRFVIVAALAAASTSCGSVVRSGDSPMFLVINSLSGAAGSLLATVTPPTEPNVLISHVAPPAVSDTGLVVLSTSLKDVTVAPIGVPTAPTTNNAVTITSYQVAYVRADGQNVQGVDVPYTFDGAATGTILTGGTLSITFELVRLVAKQESPLVQLATSSTVLSVIANVTFYGTDQVGNNINVTGSITIEFGT